MASIVSLQQVRTHLRFPTPTEPSQEDLALQTFIDAANEVIRHECGDEIPRAYSERHSGGDYKIFLYHTPVLSVENIEEGWGWITYELDYQDANTPAGDTTMFGYSLDNAETGEISRRSVASVSIPFIPGNRNIFVQYTSGVQPIPGNITLASLELVAHWYQNSQLRAVALAGTNMSYDAVEGAVYTRDTESGDQNINIGVPYRILELLKPHRRNPIIA